MNNRLKTIVIAGAAVASLPVAIFGGGMVLADNDVATTALLQTQDEGETTEPETTESTPEAGAIEIREVIGGDFLEDLAAELGITSDELTQAIKNVRLADVDEALAEGLIDEETAEAMRERIEAGDGDGIFLPGPGFGRHFPGGGPFLDGGPFFFAMPFEEAAGFLGIEESDLRERLNTGNTLGEISEELGFERQELIDYLLAEANTRIDEKLAEGDITEEQAADLRERAEERITELMDASITIHVDGEGGPFRGRFERFGPFGDDSEDDATETEDATSTVR